MMEVIEDYAKNMLKKTNIFVVLQLVWIVVYYILAILAGEMILERVLGVNLTPPELIYKYSQKIVLWINKYNGYIGIMSLIMLMAGVSANCFLGIVPLRKCGAIRDYSDFGLHAAIWLFLIYITCAAYLKLKMWFLILPFIILLFYKLIEGILGKLERHGIRFRE